MKYKINQRDNVLGGEIILEFQELKGVYLVKYSGYVDFGAKIFGKWRKAYTQNFSGDYRIPQKYLSEDFLLKTLEFDIDGISFHKKSDKTLGFNHKLASGDIYLKFDGADPVEIKMILAFTSIGTFDIDKI